MAMRNLTLVNIFSLFSSLKKNNKACEITSLWENNLNNTRIPKPSVIRRRMHIMPSEAISTSYFINQHCSLWKCIVLLTSLGVHTEFSSTCIKCSNCSEKKEDDYFTEHLVFYGYLPNSISVNSSLRAIHFCVTPSHRCESDDKSFPWTAVLLAVNVHCESDYYYQG
jgi:hypothetical protein